MSASPWLLPDSQPDQDGPLPFPHASGRGIRVAVIDSGVNHHHPHISGVADGIAIGLDPAADASSYLDALGHGTAVMAAIQEKAPAAHYYAVKLFHDSLRTSADHLIEAIEWAIDNRMDVINLSLGTRNPDHAPRFIPLLERAAASGIVLVSALEADDHACFPGSLPGVAGVGVDWEIDRHAYRIDSSGGSLYASGYPRSLPGVPRRRNLSGISFAVANMTGLIARACENLEKRSLPTLRETLVTESERINSRAAL
jgi:subtilisin family serine protease